jgi:hypothetical protein
VPSSDLAGTIDGFLQGKGSPMAGLGSVFVGSGRKYGVDPRLLVGISGIESSFGKHIYGSYNAWGWGPGKPFSSFEEGIATVAKGLRSGYLDRGLTDPYSIGKRYAPASDGNNPHHWADTVSQFMRDLGAAAPSRRTLSAQTPPELQAAASERAQGAGLQSALIQNLGDVGAHGGYADPSRMLGSLLGGLIQDRIGSQRSTAGNTPSTVPLTGATRMRGSVTLAPGADRPGASTHQDILNFARTVAGVYGSPLQITTGTNHNQFVLGTHRQSAHWTGHAADIPATGAALTRLGQAALVAAGADPAWARRQKGGLFNLGGYQVIFNSNIGGNHWNHLHVGVR